MWEPALYLRFGGERARPFFDLLARVGAELPEYVVAAINLRPELAQNVVAVAIKSAVKNLEAKRGALCGMIERIVKAAIATNPDSAVSITKAAASASPELRTCVVEAAIAVVPNAKDSIVHAATATTQPFAFLTFSATDTSGFSFTAATLSPANISNPGGDGIAYVDRVRTVDVKIP